MSYRADTLGDGRTDWRTDAGNDNTRRPILASGKNEWFNEYSLFFNPLLSLTSRTLQWICNCIFLITSNENVEYSCLYSWVYKDAMNLKFNIDIWLCYTIWSFDGYSRLLFIVNLQICMQVSVVHYLFRWFLIYFQKQPFRTIGTHQRACLENIILLAINPMA